jgi:hypothetical protein
MQRRRELRSLILFIVVPLIGVMSGCASLPDMTPFVSATAEMSSAVIASGAAVESELKPVAEFKDVAATFAQQWAVRRQAMLGLVDYADALNQISQASQSGESAVDSIANSLTGLATAAGIALPAAGVVATVTDIGKFVYNQIALVRGARSLRHAMTSAQPAIDRISEKIVLDLKDLEAIFVLANAQIRGELQTRDPIQAQLGFRNQLIAEQNRLYKKGALNLSAADSDRLLEIGRLITAADSWYLPLQAQLKAVQDRLEAGRALIAAAGDATTQWDIAHRKVVMTIQQGQKKSISVQSLALAAVQIRGLINRMREL